MCVTVPLGSASDTCNDLGYVKNVGGKYVPICRARQVRVVGPGQDCYPVLLPPRSCSPQWENGDFIVWFCSGPLSVFIALGNKNK